jgi:hypothetical protein
MIYLLLKFFIESNRHPHRQNQTSKSQQQAKTATYDHRQSRAPDPVRSPHVNPLTGRLVVKWETISEYLLLYVFVFVIGKSFELTMGELK